MTKKLIALLLLLVTFSIAHAETFVVTSNADSGPGTLREAIEKAAANGITETDYIQFNINPFSIESRTIGLRTELPDITSNVVIDGSTQSGDAIGVTNAKIRITAAPGLTISHALRFIDTKNNAVYGIHFYKLVRGTAEFYHGYGIQLHNVDSIQIGAPEKGNYFTHLVAAVSGTFSIVGRGMVKNLSFKSNIVNLTEDGSGIEESSHALVLTFPNLANVTIGGETPEEGNFISGSTEHGFIAQMDTLAHMDAGYFKILNNNFGCDITKTKPLTCGQVFIENSKSYGYTQKGDVSIIGNTFNKATNEMSFGLTPSFVVHNIEGYVDVRGNQINNLAYRDVWTTRASSVGFAIAGCGDGRIGGNDPADQNIIAGCTYSGIVLNGNKAITISKNSIYCNFPGITVLSSAYQVPKTKIFTLTDNTVAGTTLPKSKVEVFVTKKCGGCNNGERYLGTVTADDAGNWSYTSSVPFDGAVTATGTSPKGVTGEFAHPEFNIEKLETNEAVACDKITGYIKGMKVESGTRYYWLPLRGNDTLFNQLDLDSLRAGSYRFVVEQGSTCYAQHIVAITDYTPRINTTSSRLIQPSCNKKNGIITDVYTYGFRDKLFWHDEAGKVVGTEQTLSDVGPGRYKLVILSEEYGCGDSTDYFMLTNQTGPSIATTNVKVIAAACGTSTGSIQNVQIHNVTGTASIEWTDPEGVIVGRSLDLMNVTGGTYRMTLYDDSRCDITTEPIVVGGSSSTTINASNVAISPSQCAYGSGSITGVVVSGATDYEWTDQNNTVVSREREPKTLLPGTYTLTTGKSTGCPKTSPAITVPVDPDMQFNPALQTTITPATCGRTNGSVVLQNFPSPQSYTFQWKQGSADRATTLNLTNTAPGDYTLFATNASGCTQRVTSVTVPNRAQPVLQTNAVTLHHDVCTQGIGRIENLSVQPGTGTPPFAYQWFNGQGQVIANTANLQNNKAGSYYLMITDATGCAIKSTLFTLKNETKNLEPPRYADQVIPRHTSTTLTPQSGATATFERFADAALTQRLDAANTGVFAVPNLAADKTFYIRLREGTCTSTATSVTIKVADDAQVYVPTAFTPNRDGKNDVLKPLVIGIFKLEHFTVYDRWGGVVFRSNDLTKGWDGFIKGAEAPVGVYVWMLAGMDYKGNRMQQKGSFTLMR